MQQWRSIALAAQKQAERAAAAATCAASTADNFECACGRSFPCCIELRLLTFFYIAVGHGESLDGMRL